MELDADGKGLERDGAAVRELLYRMEPELRLLQGTAVVLRALSETTDSLDPAALEALATLLERTLEQLMESWREALDVARGR